MDGDPSQWSRTMNVQTNLNGPRLDHRETSQNYGRVLWRKGRWRIAVCRDDLQWLFQQRVTLVSCADARWRTRGYCLDRQSLITLQHRFLVGEWRELVTLPEKFRSGSVT